MRDGSIPVQVVGLAGVTAVAAGGEHSLAVTGDGTMWAWGSNRSGQLGNRPLSSSDVPVRVSGLTDVTAIATGYHSSLALKADETVWKWGLLGREWGPTRQCEPAQVQGLADITAITAGDGFDLALGADGSVWAWGHNVQGQLGDGTTTDQHTPVQIAALTGTAAIAVSGRGHSESVVERSYALGGDATVWAWGKNEVGELGVGVPRQSERPLPVTSLADVVTVAAGGSHSLAISSDDAVWAWGSNASGQLGDGMTVSREVPVRVSGLSQVTGVSAGLCHSLALLRDGTVWAWGDNTYGQLGNGATSARSVPAPVGGLAGIVAIVSGGTHNLALDRDGTVWMWGTIRRGVNWEPLTIWRGSTPERVGGLTDVVAVAAGAGHNLALRRDGSVWAWGDDYCGQLGDGQRLTWRLEPVAISGVSGVVAIAASALRSLAVRQDGPVRTWGAYEDWDGSHTELYSVDSPWIAPWTARLSSVHSVASSCNHDLALDSDGTVSGWGHSHDGLGTRPTAPVPGLTSAVAIASGGGHHLAVIRPVTAVSPSQASVRGGTAVTITGVEFEAATTSVTFGGVAERVTVHDWTRLTVKAPAHAVGPVDVAVTTRHGTTAVTEYRRSTGTWYVLPSSTDYLVGWSVRRGTSTDVPVQGAR